MLVGLALGVIESAGPAGFPGSVFPAAMHGGILDHVVGLAVGFLVAYPFYAGGGLKAGFWIEGAMSPDNGTATGQTWQRRSTVSLMGGFGELRLGRDYTATFWNLTIFDPFGTNGVGSALNNGLSGKGTTLGSGAQTLVRDNNMIAYFLPAMGGLYGQFQVAAGENTTGGKYFGGRIGYGAGPVNLAFAYGNTQKTGTMVDDYTNTNFGASYNFGFATLMGYYGKYEYSNLSQKQWLIGTTIPVGAGTIRASYLDTSGSTDAYGSKQYAIGYVYDLSKRTALYTTYASLQNKGNKTVGGTFVVSGNGNAGILGGETSDGYQFGIRHSF
jgi:predicted porin